MAESRALFSLRMGIHSGPVSLVTDINGQADAAGDGIIRAQRVMDVGDAGHILLSAEAASVLLQLDPWPRYLQDLGSVRVKHGQQVHLYNLYGRLDGPFCGNASLPEKVRQDGRERRIPLSVRLEPHRRIVASGLVLAFVMGAGVVLWNHPHQVRAAALTLGKRLHAAPPLSRTRKTATKRFSVRRASPVRSAVTAIPTDSRSAVPALRKLSLEDAAALAESRGLQVIERGQRLVKLGFDEGTVFFQSIAPGRKIASGSTVYVRVAAWPQERAVVSESAPEASGLADPASDIAEKPREE